jgi:hypothetical protein
VVPGFSFINSFASAVKAVAASFQPATVMLPESFAELLPVEAAAADDEVVPLSPQPARLTVSMAAANTPQPIFTNSFFNTISSFLVAKIRTLPQIV